MNLQLIIYLLYTSLLVVPGADAKLFVEQDEHKVRIDESLSFQKERENINFPYIFGGELHHENLFFYADFIENGFFIINKYHSGLDGFNVKILLDENLNIKYSVYDSWGDVEDGSQNFYVVEDVELTLNKNPFFHKKSDLVGKYSLTVKKIVTPGGLTLSEETEVREEVINGIFRLR